MCDMKKAPQIIACMATGVVIAQMLRFALGYQTSHSPLDREYSYIASFWGVVGGLVFSFGLDEFKRSASADKAASLPPCRLRDHLRPAPGGRRPRVRSRGIRVGCGRPGLRRDVVGNYLLFRFGIWVRNLVGVRDIVRHPFRQAFL